jgi:hypothetical protein
MQEREEDRPASVGEKQGTRTLDERVAMAFWILLFGVFASVCGAIGASLLHIDPTEIEAGLVGAFLGSSPVILMPIGSRLIFGAESGFAKRDRLRFRALTLLWGALIVASRFLHWWPAKTGHTSSVIAIGGLIAAVLASWFWPYMPAAARVWARQQASFHESR